MHPRPSTHCPPVRRPYHLLSDPPCRRHLDRRPTATPQEKTFTGETSNHIMLNRPIKHTLANMSEWRLTRVFAPADNPINQCTVARFTAPTLTAELVKRKHTLQTPCRLSLPTDHSLSPTRKPLQSPLCPTDTFIYPRTTKRLTDAPTTAQRPHRCTSTPLPPLQTPCRHPLPLLPQLLHKASILYCPQN